MEWTPLTDVTQLDALDRASLNAPVLIMKHSTRCNISRAALDRLERGWTDADRSRSIHFVDVLRHREVSNAIAERYGVQHESPQTLVIKDGRCIRSEAHFGITYRDTIAAMEA